MSKFSNFVDFVKAFDAYATLPALEKRSFIKIHKVSYAELQKQTYKIANFLADQGLSKGDRLMVIAPNSPFWVELFLASQLLGAILVSVDARLSLENVNGFIKQTSPTLIFRSRFLLSELKQESKVYTIEDLEDLAKGYKDDPPKIRLSGDEDSVIVFTSGTTASPKGVVLTQKNILTNVCDATAMIPITSDWRLLSVLPLSHMYELTGGCLSILAAGASIFYLAQITPKAISEGLKEHHITTMLAIPELLSLFLKRINQTAEDKGQLKALQAALKIAPLLPFKARRLLFHAIHKELGGKLNLIVTGGAPIPADVAKTWQKIGVNTIEGYGLTETSPILTLNPLDDSRIGFQGKPLPQVSLRINASDQEVQAKGPSIFKKYWNQPETTKEAFTKNGWFKTGDTGTIKDGFLKIQGRLKFAIVLPSGLKVFPEDIEQATIKHPKLQQCCIVGLNTPHGEQVHALLISKLTDKQVDQEIAAVNQELEPFQAIQAWRRWPDSDFPRTRLLKVDRAKVQAWANAQIKETPKGPAIANSDELKELISQVTDTSSRGIKDSERLSTIGLDSLRRLTLITLIEEKLGVSVAEESITSKTTVSDLRRLINHATTIEQKPVSPKWPYASAIRFIGNILRDSLIQVILRVWVKLTIEGREHLKEINGPAIYIFNHLDNFDGPIVYRVLPRHIRRRLAVATAADVMDEHKILAFVIRLFYAGFRFSRKEPYMPSLEYVGSLVDSGWSIVISPEGRLSTDGQLQPFKNGIGLLAVELGIPVVIIKSFGLFGTVPVHKNWPQKRSKATIRISKPIRFDSRSDYQQATRSLHDLMLNL